MSKKVFIKTLLTTSTVGLLGGGIAASLVGCSPKGTRALIIESTSPVTGEVGKDLTITCSYREIGFKDRNLEIIGEEFKLSRIIDDETFEVILPASTDAGKHDLRVYDSFGDVESNSIAITLTQNVDKVLTITPNDTELVVGESYQISGTIAAANFDDITTETFELTGADANKFENLTPTADRQSFTVDLKSGVTTGKYSLQIHDADKNVSSNVVTITLSNPVISTLTIQTSGSTTGTVGNDLVVTGTWSASNFFPTFNDLDLVDLDEKLTITSKDATSFTVKLDKSAEVGDYGLQFIANGVLSNVITLSLTQNPVKVLTITAYNTELVVGGSYTITGTIAAANFDITELTLIGADAGDFKNFSVDLDNHSFTVDLYEDKTARSYSLQMYDANKDVSSNIIPITLSNPVISTLTIQTSGATTGTVGTDLVVTGTWKASNFSPTFNDLELVNPDEKLTITSKDATSFSVTLDKSAEVGYYDLQFKAGNVESNIITINVVYKVEKTLVISTSDTFFTNDGTSHRIYGSVTAANFDITGLTLTGDDASKFILNTNLADGTFVALMADDTPVGSYSLQIQDTTAGVLSNVITIKVESPVEKAIEVSLEKTYVTYEDSTQYTLDGKIKFFNFSKDSLGTISIETNNQYVTELVVSIGDEGQLTIEFALSEKVIDTIQFWIKAELTDGGYVESNILYVTIAEEPDYLGFQITVGETNVYTDQQFDVYYVVDSQIISRTVNYGFYGDDADKFTYSVWDPPTSRFSPKVVRDTPPGKYKLQMLLTLDNSETILSNIITITVVDYYNMDGTNWQGYQSGSLALELDQEKKTAMIIEDSGSHGYVADYWVIPPYVSDGMSVYTVIGIEDIESSSDTFLSVQHVTFPLTFMKIGNYAFYNAGLITIPIIPERMDFIGDSAFAYNPWGGSGGLVIPMSVTGVGESAFITSSGASEKISSITITNPGTKFGTNAFENQGDGINLYMPNYNVELPDWGVGLNSTTTSLNVYLVNSSKVEKTSFSVYLHQAFTNQNLTINFFDQ